MIRKEVRSILVIAALVVILASCNTLHRVEQLPEGVYSMTAKDYGSINPVIDKPAITGKRLQVLSAQDENLFYLRDAGSLSPLSVNEIKDSEKVRLTRTVLDLDVITIPFKIRPSVEGFPQQMNATFNGALYLGQRNDIYTVAKDNGKLRLTGHGYGFGAFLGVGSVTMNPFVLQNTVDYEYDGFVIQGGLAGIYDAKRFNFGLAIGSDLLMDKNRGNWIYQGKPWIGMLFGIQLN
ncbi:hypothetical protein EZ428_18935 [Pedobacter frigiditerrae]|uniref:Uncharacterized protein n=1 Tax=Pedobacter frigiditerrae TaxID=2530452 RepID=A0A4R0MPX7_9SPHI|nr:hypothetical protein [Pedobacter frigiditerrae]TCC88713.1 hypothetical protein EZ428_18935 [Pedobacter frigiditerrae]